MGLRWLTALIYVVPWVIIPSAQEPFWRPKEYVLISGLLLWCVYATMPTKPNKFLAVWRWPMLYIAGWLVWQCYAKLAWNSTGSVGLAPELLFVTWNVLIAWWALTKLVGLPTSVWMYFAKHLGCSAALVAGVMCLQALGYDQLFAGAKFLHPIRALGSFANPMVAGHYVALGGTCLLGFRRWAWLWPVCVLACWMAACESALIALLVGAAVFVGSRYLSGRQLVFAGAVVGLVAVGVAWQMDLWHAPSVMQRKSLWIAMNDVWKDQSWTGLGLGSTAREFAWHEYLPGRKFHAAHSEWIQIAFEGGWIMVGLVAWAGWRMIRPIWQMRARMPHGVYAAMTIPVLLICSYGFPLRIAPSALTILIWFAGVLTLAQEAT